MGSLLEGGSSQTQSTEVTLPGWAESGMKDAMSMAQTAAHQQFQPYTDQRFADFTPDELAAFDSIRGLQGTTAGQMGQAQNISAQVAQQGLQGIDPNLIQSYMNPYTTQVMDVQAQRANLAHQTAQRDLAAQAAQGSAFGGSRFGLAEAGLQSSHAANQAQLEAQMLQQGYSQALGAAQQGLGMAQQGAGQMGQLAGQGLQFGLQEAGALGDIGAMQRGLEQQGLDFDYDQYIQAQQDPMIKAQFLAGIANPLASTVAGSTTTMEQQESMSPISAALGIGSLIAAPFTGGMSAFASGGLLPSGTEVMGGFINNRPSTYNPATTAPPRKPFNRGGLAGVQKYQEGGLSTLWNKEDPRTIPFWLGQLGKATRERAEQPLTSSPFIPQEGTRLERGLDLLGNLSPFSLGERAGEITTGSLAKGYTGLEDFLTTDPDVEMSVKDNAAKMAEELLTEAEKGGKLTKGEKEAFKGPSKKAKDLEGGLQGRTLTIDDLMAKIEERTAVDEAKAQSKALRAFGARMLSSGGESFFKALGGATEAYDKAIDSEQVKKLTKEKAIQELASDRFQKELNRRQIATLEKQAETSERFKQFEMMTKLSEAMNKGLIDEKDIFEAVAGDPILMRSIGQTIGNPNLDTVTLAKLLNSGQLGNLGGSNLFGTSGGTGANLSGFSGTERK